MKRKIRRGCFETNSSSMHSLVILKDDSLNKELNRTYWIYLDTDKMLNLGWGARDLYFGRSPFQYLHTTEEKIEYAIASLCGYRKNANEIFKEIEKITMEIIPGCKGIELPKDDITDNEFDYGGVDEDILTSFLEKNNISLKEFLTNDKYVVVVDGDEYLIFEDMKKSGLINTDIIESEWTSRDVYYYEKEKS